jgi:hypothetical protein
MNESLDTSFCNGRGFVLRDYGDGCRCFCLIPFPCLLGSGDLHGCASEARKGGGVYERDAVIGARGLGMKWEFGGLNPCCWLYLAVVDPLIDPDSEHVVPVSIFNPSLRVPLSSLFSHCLAPPVSLL